MSNAFTVDLDSYRWRNNDGTEVTATYNKDINLGITVGDEGGTDFGFGAILRLRALLQETGGDMGMNNAASQLQFDVDGAESWVNVDASSSIVQSIASELADGSDTTAGAHDLGAGTFVTPNALQDDADGLAGGATLDIGAGEEWEPESSFQVIANDVADGEVITFRFLTAAGAPNTTTNVPTLTVDKAAADTSAVEWAGSGGMPTQMPVLPPIAIVPI